MKTFYMHTLNGRPAYYDGTKIVFAMRGGYVRRGQWLCESLDEIRKQQRQSFRWRRDQGLDNRWDHGYVRMHVSERNNT